MRSELLARKLDWGQHLLVRVLNPELNLPFVDPPVQAELGEVATVCSCSGVAQIEYDRKKLVLISLAPVRASGLERPLHDAQHLVLGPCEAELHLVRSVRFPWGDVDEHGEHDVQWRGQLRAVEPRDPSAEDVQEPLSHRRSVAEEGRVDPHGLRATMPRLVPSGAPSPYHL